MAKQSKASTSKVTALAKITKSENGMQVIDLESGPMPDLAEATAAPIDIVGTYWTPEVQGESKRLIFSHIALSKFKDQTSEEEVELETAHFFENQNGNAVSITNASKRLVGALINSNVMKGTPLMITWIGKRRNKSNSFMSDNWSIKPLIIQIPE